MKIIFTEKNFRFFLTDGGGSTEGIISLVFPPLFSPFFLLSFVLPSMAAGSGAGGVFFFFFPIHRKISRLFF